jgi:hypothetical protein
MEILSTEEINIVEGGITASELSGNLAIASFGMAVFAGGMFMGQVLPQRLRSDQLALAPSPRSPQCIK